MNRNITDSKCIICGKSYAPDDLIPARSVRDDLAKEIRTDHPEWGQDGFICRIDLDHYREMYVQHAIEEEKGELTDLEQQVVKAIADQELMSRDVNKDLILNFHLGNTWLIRLQN